MPPTGIRHVKSSVASQYASVSYPSRPYMDQPVFLACMYLYIAGKTLSVFATAPAPPHEKRQRNCTFHSFALATARGARA